MQELRFNPLLGTYTIVAAHRQHRPNMPIGWCPFCPGEGKKVPLDYEVLVYPNDFPAMSPNPEIITPCNEEPYHNKDSVGYSDVILYSPNHEVTLSELSDAHVIQLIKTWASLTQKYAEDERIKYVFPFENRGQAVGVTMPHPHGQLYAYSFLPLKIKTELSQCIEYYNDNERNLFDDILNVELMGKRTLIDSTYFWVGIPYFTDYPFGIFIIAKNPVLYFHELTEEQHLELAQILKAVNGTFDRLYNKIFPYMMCVHQGSVNIEEVEKQESYYRLHIEYYPPWRGDEVIKYYASSEMGAWAATNTVCIEDSIVLLREALNNYHNADLR